MTLRICLETLEGLRHFKNTSYSQKWSSLLYFLFWCSLLDWWQRPLLRCSESTHICLPTAELDYLKYRQSQGGDNCVFMNSGSSTVQHSITFLVLLILHLLEKSKRIKENVMCNCSFGLSIKFTRSPLAHLCAFALCKNIYCYILSVCRPEGSTTINTISQ